MKECSVKDVMATEYRETEETDEERSHQRHRPGISKTVQVTATST